MIIYKSVPTRAFETRSLVYKIYILHIQGVSCQLMIEGFITNSFLRLQIQYVKEVDVTLD